jgi:glycogen(starch) synthase
MRLPFLTNNRFPPREGIGRHVLEVAGRLRQRGHAVTVLARGGAFAPWTETTVDGLRIRHYPHYPLRPLHHALDRAELAGWLHDGADGAELLHVHLPLLPPLPTARCRLPSVATIHSPMLRDTAAIVEPGLRTALIKVQARLFSFRYEQWYLDHAVALVAVSQKVAGELGASYRVRRQEPPVIVPNGVDTGFFAFTPFHGREELMALYVGRLGYRKGLFRLLDALARLPGLTLVMAGEGPLDAALRRHAVKLGVASRVEFVGFLDRAGVRAQLRRAACFVNPADYETGPLTLLEAMAAGTPVVSTPTGLAAEMGREPPLLLAAADPTALADAIRTTLTDPEAAAARAIRARALVARDHDWEQVVDRLESVYGVPARRAA